MQQWIYYDYMGQNNPVCDDVGKIEEIHETTWTSNCMLETIKADGMTFSGGIHPLYVRFGHYFPLNVMRADDAEIRYLPNDIHYGDELEISPHIIWKNPKGETLEPVCTDPRVLYIALKGWLIHPSASKQEVERWRQDIPTREFAEKWMKERDLLYVCTPPDHAKSMIERLTGRQYEAEMRKLMPRAYDKED